ncbi:MAG: SDR family oxidoreductase [Rubrivivax sp.]|nr:SDR family oxidoreductase [Rubrivivax sp.]
MSETKTLAVVTGAASGIGAAVAGKLAARGVSVIIADVQAERGEARAAELQALGQPAQFVAVDLTDRDSIDAFAATVGEKFGAVDILVNAAGWGRTAPFWEGTREFWDQLIALNLIGPMHLSQALLAPMRERGSGSIVNIASDAGRVGSLGETVYSAAKAGLIGFTKSLARETARYGIRVNCVCPGPTDTALMAAVPDKVKDALIKAIPLRRLARPEEVADAVLYFAGADASYVTGQVISVSGGLTMAG